MTSRARVPPRSDVSASPRVTMSRSVTIPTSLSPSATGTAPMFSSRILFAKSATGVSGLATLTGAVITLLISMLHLQVDRSKRDPEPGLTADAPEHIVGRSARNDHQ